MSLSDTAEYWNDFKASFNRTRTPWVHIEGRPCGELVKGTESKDYENCTCNKCKKTDQYKNLKKLWTCSCGKDMRKMTNRTTGQIFLGCVRWPRCRNTKSLT